MTVSEFSENLGKAYTGLNPVHRRRIIQLVSDGLDEHAYRHFFDYLIDKCNGVPTAYKVRELLDAYVRGISTDHYGQSIDEGDDECPYGKCDGTKFIQFQREHDGRMLDYASPCLCHPGRDRILGEL